MCRWIAYTGSPIFMSRVVTEPCRSLVHQSLQAAEAKTVINGDGFGIGWYGEHAEPGLFRDLRPAWGDENLMHLTRQIRSHLFFAHVRSSTGTATARANCHPFVNGKFLFMHNGQVGQWGKLRRGIEGMIPDAFYHLRTGTTDSEALFLIAMARGAEHDPIGAMEDTLSDVMRLAEREGVTEALRFTAALANGQDLIAFRWASDDKPPSLYFRDFQDGLLVASEPLDEERASWEPVPPNHVLVARKGDVRELTPFNVKTRVFA